MHVITEPTERIRALLGMDKRDLPADGGPRFNRLIFEKSPYLLQHAENPVDWRPWGDEAFAAAREQDKPVFLSIGYATCHWCHVMEKESFESPEVAGVLNRFFIPVKVDREERPDIDDGYMTAAQLLNGSGGWPLNLVITPDRLPFFAATYIPPQPRGGMPGIVELLRRIADLWQKRKGELADHGALVAAELARVVASPRAGEPAKPFLDQAFRKIGQIYDGAWGGFGEAPKFPMPHFIDFLLLYSVRRNDPAPAAMAEQTLEKMRAGGICDQLGFGFHRYSVDREWLVPHFEKMLYDQALIAGACLRAYRRGGRTLFLTMAEEVFDCVLAEAGLPEGGFAAGLDADSEGEEGTFYLWSREEILGLIGDGGENCCRFFGVTSRGNFEGKNILTRALLPEEFARSEGLDPDRFPTELERWRTVLLAARSRRPRPLRDEKMLCGWNGLMIASLAQGYAVTGNCRYLDAAARALDAVCRRLTRDDGRLLRSWHGGGDVPAFLEDYAFLVWGMIELYQATLEERYLGEALRLTREMIRLFGAEGGAFRDCGADAEEVLVRTRSAADGVIPAGNSVAALSLLRLGRIAGDDDLFRAGEGIVRGFSGDLAQRPANHLHLLQAVDFLLGERTDVAIVGGAAGERRALLREVHRRFIPGLVLRGEPGEGGAVARVCSGNACLPEVRSTEELGELLDSLAGSAPTRQRG